MFESPFKIGNDELIRHIHSIVCLSSTLLVSQLRLPQKKKKKKNQSLGGLNNRDLIFHGSRGWEVQDQGAS